MVDAVTETVRRVDETYELEPHHQVAVIVMDCSGAISAAALRPGFRVAIVEDGRHEVVDPDVVLHPEDGVLPESAIEGLAKTTNTPKSEES